MASGRHYYNAAPYRAVERATGHTHDFRKAQDLMDWLFAVGAYNYSRRFTVYKDAQRVKMPAGGEVSEIARWLEAA